MAEDKETRIPITMTQGASAKDISDAIGAFFEQYDKKNEANTEEDDKE